jgi:hypothetical protein
MADHYEDYPREQLVHLPRERDKRPRFGLVCCYKNASPKSLYLCDHLGRCSDQSESAPLHDFH